MKVFENPDNPNRMRKADDIVKYRDEVEKYSPCKCGSGKKAKFCKCGEYKKLK